MTTEKRFWSNPYKTRLWFGSQDGELGNYHLKELFFHILSRGPKGCGDRNSQLSLEIHRSRATVKRYLYTLKKHHLIEIVPGWAELNQGEFRKTLRYRRIYALPWPNKRSWMAASIQKDLDKVGSKMSHLQRSTHKMSINRQRDELLYTLPNPPEVKVASEAEAGVSDSSPIGLPTDCCSGGQKRLYQAIRKSLISKLIFEGYPRDAAISKVDSEIQKILVQRKSDHKKSETA